MSGNIKKGHLLIVDDESDIVEILSETMKPYTSEISTATNGLDALKIIQQGEVDAVMSDVNMPKMSGLHLLAHIRSMGLDLPFVVVTAYGDRNNLQESIRLNATDFIDKPFELGDVVRVMTQCLELGLALKDLDQSLHRLFEHSALPGDEVVRLKKVRKAISMMKMQFVTQKSAKG